MAQNTRQDITRGRFQSTRQDTRSGRRETGAKLSKTQYKGRSDEEKLIYLYGEIADLWDNLQGRGSDKSLKNPRMRISQFLDQEGRIKSIWNGEDRLDGEEITEHIDDSLIFDLAAQDYSYDDRGSVIAPASWQAGLGGSRISGWEIPTGTTSIWFWHGLPFREDWKNTGELVKSTLYYGFAATPSIGDTIAVWSTGFCYDDGDDLTSPTIQWNEGDTAIPAAGKVPGYIYSHSWVEASATLSSNDFMSHRVTFARGNAGYIYNGGSTYFYGMRLEFYNA